MIAKKQRLLIRVVIIVVSLVLIAGITFAVLYLNTDLFKSNESLFLKYASQNTKLATIVDEDWISQYIQKTQNNAYTNQGSLSYNGKSSEENSNKKANILNNMKIQFQGRTDTANKRQAQTIQFMYSDKEILKADYQKSQDTYALKSDEVVTKFVGIENNKLKEFFTKMGKEDVSSIPDKIEPLEVKTFLSISQDQIMEMGQTYLPIYKQQIQKEQYTKQQETITINGQASKVNAYTLKLNENEVDDTKKAMLTQLKQDETTLQWIISKFDQLKNSGVNPFSEELADSLADRLEAQDILVLKKQGMNQDVLKKIIQSEIDKINKKSYQNQKEYAITVYENKRELVQMKIVEAENILQIQYAQNGEESKIWIDTQTVKAINDEDNTFQNQIEIVKKKNGESYQLNISNTTSKNNNQNGKYAFQLSVEGNLNGSAINQIVTVGYNKENKEIATIKYENKQDYSSKEAIAEDSNQDNLAKLNDFDKETNQQLITSINKRLQQLYNEKMQVLGIDPSILANDTVMKMIEFNNQIVNVDKAEEKRMQEAIINSELEMYKGNEISGESVKALVEKVERFNKIEQNDLPKQIILNVDNVDYTMTEQNIKAIKDNIKSDEVYRVNLNYSDQTGLVNKVLINVLG